MEDQTQNAELQPRRTVITPGAQMRTSIFAIALVIAVAFLRMGNAFVEGPPPATTGGFGEETCRKCHYDFEENDPAGSLLLEGFPETYVVGRQYTLTIRLMHPRLERGGFELAARFASGDNEGRQAGFLESSDDRVSIVSSADAATHFARQTRAGSAPQTKGQSAWTVRWRAPETGSAPIVFHVAANAANFDDSPLGDYPYSAQQTVRPAGVIRRLNR
jgi:hypothetical protein